MNPNAHVPEDDLDLLVWWLDLLQHRDDKAPFTVSAQLIIMPRQIDSFSCGIVVLSTIAWILLDFAPWTQHLYAHERIEWFLRLAANLRSNVGDYAL
jgi:hypothetical protein